MDPRPLNTPLTVPPPLGPTPSYPRPWTCVPGSHPRSPPGDGCRCTPWTGGPAPSRWTATTGASSCCPRRRRRSARTGGIGRARRLDHAGHRRPAAVHQLADALARLPAALPRRQPDRRIRARGGHPRRVGRAPRRPAGRCRRERADRRGERAGRRASARTPTWRPSSTSPSGTDRRGQHRTADRRQVVRRLASSRTRTSGGTAASPARSSSTPPIRCIWPT